jgi:F5/8 type C domain
VGSIEQYAVDQQALRTLVQQILSRSDRRDQLYRTIDRLYSDRQLQMQAAVFESVYVCGPVRDFGTLFLMVQCYNALGRNDACYALATSALAVASDDSRRELLREFVEAYLTERGCYRFDTISENQTSLEIGMPELSAPIEFPVPLVNVAFGKPSTQSSDAGHRDAGKPIGAGATSGVKTGGWGFHTEYEENPWWCLNLLHPYQVRRIVVFNRETANTDYSATLSISLGQTSEGPWQKVHQQSAPFGGHLSKAPLIVNLPEPVSAQYLRFQLHDTKALHLDEVEVYAAPEPGSEEARIVEETYSLISQVGDGQHQNNLMLVNGDVWNRAAFCARFGIDQPRAEREWLHGIPHIMVDRGKPFDGRPGSFRMQGLGGFGNVFYEFMNACLIARAVGCQSIVAASTIHLPNDVPFDADGLRICPPGQQYVQRLEMFGTFYWPRGAEDLVGPYSTDTALDLIRRCAQPVYKHYLHAAGSLGDHVMALHFRGGDIFEKGPVQHGWYVQPPVSYYVKAIKFGIARLGVTDIHLVFQDKTNPCVDLVAQYLTKLGIPFTEQSSSVFTDVATLLSASHIVAPYGTFSESIGLLSDRVRSYIGFRSLSTQQSIRFWMQSRVEDILRAKGARTFVIDDPDGSYIKPETWRNLPEQHELMHSFPETKLRLMERLTPAELP